MIESKWPKVLSPLAPAQQKISDDFMEYWHKTLAKQSRYHLLEQFNHGYVVKNSPRIF